MDYHIPAPAPSETWTEPEGAEILHDHPQPTLKEEPKMEGIASDKVNINVGGEGRSGYDGGAGLAAVIAALGNRNQGNDMAGLIAALGNRNEKDYGPLLAMMANNRHDDHGIANMWPLLLLLLGRRGFGDGDHCDHDGGVSPAQAALLQTLLEGQSDLRAAVPTAALETQGVVQSSAANTKDAIQNSLIAELTALAGVKDAVQNGFTLTGRDIAAVNQNVSAQGCQTRETVEAAKTEILTALRQNVIDDLRHRADRAERAVEVTELRSRNEVTQMTIVNQRQEQEQRQRLAEFDALSRRLDAVIIGNQFVANRQGQDVINFGGTMTASGTQAAANTAVR